MTKAEREILSKKISAMTKNNKYSWQDLKEQIADHGYQEYYPIQEDFEYLINLLVEKLEDNEKKILTDEWKKQKQRIQFETDQEYLEQYKLFIMEELIQRARKATYYL